MPKITAQIPEDIYMNINEEVRLGIFSDASEAVASALKKAYARRSKSFFSSHRRFQPDPHFRNSAIYSLF